MNNVALQTPKIEGSHGTYAELASEMDAAKRKGKWAEIGTMGLSSFSGWLRLATLSELEWPEVYVTFNRLRRTDPEISIIRLAFGAIGSEVKLYWQGPEKPTPADDEALAFAEQVLDDLENGSGAFRDQILAYVPFMGWAWWEVVPGLRRQGWKPPGDDLWRSKFDDGLIGIRRLGFRDHSSFYRWDMSDRTGQLRGLIQHDPPNQPVTIPLERSVHLRFGDVNNPEGLSPLESVYRLERYKYALEIIQGIGFEHAAGHLSVNTDEAGPDVDKESIKAAARNLMTAQEGNFAIWPEGVTGEIMDVPFQAAPSLLSSIQFYSNQKLQQYLAQWVALSVTTGTGSYAAKTEDTSMFTTAFNAMIQGLVEQADQQLGEWLFKMNADAFPGMTERPHLKATKIQKAINLSDLGSFLTDFKSAGFSLDLEDENAIRRKSDFLPERDVLAEEGPADSTDSTETDEGQAADQVATAEQVKSAMARFREWAAEHAPSVHKILMMRAE